VFLSRRFVAILGVFTGMMACASGPQLFRNISTEEAAALLKNSSTFLLDVRTPAEFAGGRLPGATLIPVQELSSRGSELPADKDRPILIYCRSGNRSVTAAKQLAKEGYTNLHNMKGGMIAWRAEARPVDSGIPR
jgi:rhodanese-related sulfurtransferase